MKKRRQARPGWKRSAQDLAERNGADVKGGTLARAVDPSNPNADRPAEEVAFYYNKIAFSYAATGDGE